MKILILVASLFALSFSAGHHYTDYTPKQLMKEIEQYCKCENPVFEEFQLNSLSPEENLNGKFFKYSKASPVAYSYIGRVLTCRAKGCLSHNEIGQTANSEFFDYYILFDSAASILSVYIFNYEASHGQEITVKSWLKQFQGYNNSKKLVVGKTIDAISGATISVHAITNDIGSKTNFLRKHLTEMDVK